ncbi:hypothetical protein COCCADRAFT_30590 [Bipolaris zeicola 26-R-13]|uniref:Uncharacterized protein n=1 Tax=Cochliobolus carbonum (strain 26-R-13) TaxID=930089 RepID=W6XLF9_COCC2|nr:uncharacterized protein COCCADRAFT_30590 [Bipolaris zeicola 26-R-13]EUC28082.1 hypothetical protein COCCADRAFT_30590 [Bipolaris zeicola 26-R-13]
MGMAGPGCKASIGREGNASANGAGVTRPARREGPWRGACVSPGAAGERWFSGGAPATAPVTATEFQRRVRHRRQATEPHSCHPDVMQCECESVSSKQAYKAEIGGLGGVVPFPPIGHPIIDWTHAPLCRWMQMDADASARIAFGLARTAGRGDPRACQYYTSSTLHGHLYVVRRPRLLTHGITTTKTTTGQPGAEAVTRPYLLAPKGPQHARIRSPTRRSPHVSSTAAMFLIHALARPILRLPDHQSQPASAPSTMRHSALSPSLFPHFLASSLLPRHTRRLLRPAVEY